MKPIVLTGGGTLGPVTTLLAIAPFLKKQGYVLQWVGTRNGPERAIVEAAGIPFTSIVAPKFRRYFSWRHLLVPCELILGCVQAFRYLSLHKPAAIVSAGGFVSVPVVWMGWLLKIPSVIHQQDVRLGLANMLMATFASRITVTFQDSARFFSKAKTVWTGNPVRDLQPTTNAIVLDSTVPTVLIFGGGTGAQAINTLVSAALCEYANVIHLTGIGKTAVAITHPRYHRFDLLKEEMKEALAKADVVVCRAGLGTLTELAALGKPAIVIPMPRTHQEYNAAVLRDAEAAVVCDQRVLTPETFTQEVRSLLYNTQKCEELKQNISAFHRPDSAFRIAEIVSSVAA